MNDPEATVSRRGILKLATGTMAAGSATEVTAAQETGTSTGNATGGNQSGNATGGGESQTGNATDGAANGTGQEPQGGGTTHTVEMTDELVYDPEDITVAPGDTIVWENVGSVGHTVTAYADEIPDEAAYFASGGFDSEDAARSAYAPGDPDSGDIGEGETYEHTFQVLGDYEYFCIPHEAPGMVGSVTVSEGGGQAAPDGGADTGPQVPGFAQSIVIGLTAGLLAILSLVYVFITFGGNYSFEDSGEDG